jgi:hypothetical protein
MHPPPPSGEGYIDQYYLAGKGERGKGGNVKKKFKMQGYKYRIKITGKRAR